MIINNGKLVDLLVKKTSLEKEQVEEQLRQLTEHIYAEVEKDGTFKVAGLGEFNLLDGVLYFTAEENLATEINYKYAGMKPIELIGAFKDIQDLSVVKEREGAGSEDSVFDIEEYREETTEEEAESEEPRKPEEQVEAATETEEESKPEGPLDEVVIRDELTTEKTEEPLSASQTEEDTAALELDESFFEKEEPQEEKEAVTSPRQEEKSEDPIGKILVTAVIVIALCILGWLVYDMGFSDNEENNGGNVSENRSAAIVPNLESAKPGNDSSASDTATTGSSQEETGSEQNQLKPGSNVTSIVEESRQSVYGLRGGAVSGANDGYTIVIHSRRDEAIIRRLNQELQKEGYRTVVFSAGVMDTTFWRLGLGQFKTIKDAIEAASTLPDSYRKNHFIKRIK